MNPPNRITLIRHHYNQAELNDTVSRYLRERGCEVIHRYPFDGDPLDIKADDFSPTVVLGGGQNVSEIANHPYLENELRWIDGCIERNLPVLGICLGGQLIAHTLGARVSARTDPECEFGFYQVCPTTAAGELLGGPQYFTQAHMEEFDIPDGARLLAESERYPHQAFSYDTHVIGLQFHPEVTTPIFRDWQRDEWSAEMSAFPGAQSRQEQDALLVQHMDAQISWFEQFLERLFLRKGED